MDMYKLGNAIREARINKRLTQENVSEMLDITPVHYANIEGGRRNPSVPLLFRMMEILEFSVDELVFGTPSQRIETNGLSIEEAKAIDNLIQAIKAHKK